MGQLLIGTACKKEVTVDACDVLQMVRHFLGFKFSKNIEEDSPNLKLHGSNGSDHSYNRADSLLTLKGEGLVGCYIYLR